MLGSSPHARTAILTCMDPRIQLSKALGSHASAAFVIRNGGGRVTDDVFRSLVLCTRVLRVTEIAILHHTDCRLQEFSDEELFSRTGVDIDFMSFSAPDASVSEDIARLYSYGVFNDVHIWGGIYAVESHTTRLIAGTHNGSVLLGGARVEASGQIQQGGGPQPSSHEWVSPGDPVGHELSGPWPGSRGACEPPPPLPVAPHWQGSLDS
jgi:carbonic anhydrase